MDIQAYNLYKVERLDDIIGNEHAIAKLRNFSRDVNKGKACMPLLLYGPTGTGKSTAISLLAKEAGWNVVELNASDYRDKQSIEGRMLSAATSRSLMGGRNLILLDEVDEMAAARDRGASSGINTLLSKSRNPMIFIANDMWDQSISFLRGKTDPVEFKKLMPATVEKVLLSLQERLSLKLSRSVIEIIANRANGDARSAINDLSVLIGTDDDSITEVIGLRDRKIDIFYLLDRIFTTNTLSASLRAVTGTDLTNDMLIKWLDENIPKRYSYSSDMYDAFDSLARASTFAARAQRVQYYTYWRYMNVFMSSGVALSKRHSPEARTAYSFPRVIKELSGSKAQRVQDTEIAEKLRRVFHSSSSRIIRGEMRMLAQLIAKSLSENKDSKEEIMDELTSVYQLDGKEVEHMLGRVGFN